MKALGIKPIAQNKKAYHDYFIEETLEAGIVLTGTEVKSLRAGRVNLRDSYAAVEKGELFLIGVHISPYEQGNIFNHDPLRNRKLLVHARELRRLYGKVKVAGLHPGAHQDVLQGRRAKVEIGLAKGKATYDKRQTLAKKEAERDMERALPRRRDGRVDSLGASLGPVDHQAKGQNPIWNFSMTQWLQKILEAHARLAMPITTSPGMELLGRPIGDLFVDGQVQSECIVALARKYPSIAALTQMDLSVEAEAFGGPVKLSDAEAPTISSSVVTDLASVQALAVPRWEPAGPGNTSGPPGWRPGGSTTGPCSAGSSGRSHWPAD